MTYLPRGEVTMAGGLSMGETISSWLTTSSSLITQKSFKAFHKQHIDLGHVLILLTPSTSKWSSIPAMHATVQHTSRQFLYSQRKLRATNVLCLVPETLSFVMRQTKYVVHFTVMEWGGENGPAQEKRQTLRIKKIKKGLGIFSFIDFCKGLC